MPALIKNLANGLLPLAKATLYTVPSNTTAVALSINVVNNSGSPYTFNLYYKKFGGASKLISPKDLSLDPGYSFPLKIKLTMGAGDVIEGDGSTASYLEYVVSGVEVGSTVTTTTVVTPLDIQVVETTVTAAELMNLVAVPKQLAPAPGAGFFSQVFRVVVNRAAGTAYTVGANVMQIGCIDGVTQRRQLYMDITAGFLGAGNLFLSTTESTYVFNGPTGTSGTTIESATPVLAPGTPLTLENKELMLWATPADLSGGTGSIKFFTYYFVLPVR